MTSKGRCEIISFSAPKSLVEEMERMSRDCPKRSEFIRRAIRSLIRQKRDLSEMDGRVEGIMVVLYDRRTANQVSELMHKNDDITRSRMHSDFRGSKCCDAVSISGDAKRVKKMICDLEATSNLERAELFIA